MNKSTIQKIDLGLLRKELRKFENMWVAISGENKIIGSGSTYAETIKKINSKEDIMLLRVPPLNASLAPSA
ncbi:MAG: DUF5678 domain-containing protein [Patescibacteria group bacterium]